MKCSKSDFDISLYQSSEFARDNIDKALCMENPEEVKMKGNFNTDGFQMLSINVNRCSGKNTICKSKEEIDQFLDTTLLLLGTTD